MGARRRRPENVDGDWYVDDACIDCDACRQLAPDVFADVRGQSAVVAAPGDRVAAMRALLACPVGAIHNGGEKVQAEGLFPAPIAGGVHYCGYNAETSFGANAFLAVRPGGNLLVDSPRYVVPLARRIEALGGVAHVLLTHRDDVADAERWARHFGARVWIHEDDARAAPFATDLLRGPDPTPIAEGLVAWPVPGHTRGSVVFHLDDDVLFTGDSLYWNRARGDLAAFRDACWYSWEAQTRSLGRLVDVPFSWVLAGHGDRAHRPPAEMRARLAALVARMAGSTRDPWW